MSRPERWPRGYAVAAALAIAVLGGGNAPRALAHAGIVKLEPGRKAVLKTSPSRIVVTFSEPIEAGYSTLSLFDATGHEPPHGKAAVAVDDRRRLVLPVESLEAGSYTVKFRALSLDGHVVSGEYGFRVGPDR